MKTKFLFFILVTMAASAGWAQGLTFTSGNTETGVVKDLDPDAVIFMRVLKKQFDATDDAFTARSVQLSIEKIPYEEVKALNGVPIAAYKVLYSYNPLYRMVEKLTYRWTVAMGGGTFVGQAKALFLFLLLLGILVPLLVWLGAKLTGSQMGFMMSVLMSVVIYAIGYGLIKGFEAMTVNGIGFMQGAGGQKGVTFGAMILVGLFLGMITKENIVSGLAMVVGWFAGIYAAMWIITIV